MIDMIISSKNRPAQLDLLLRSIDKHFKNVGTVMILYKADSEYIAGYHDSRHDYRFSVGWWQEKDFCIDFKKILSLCNTDCVLFNSDDNVFIREVKIPRDFKLNSDIIAFSLRLGRGINYCLPAKLEVEEPEYDQAGMVLSWDWEKRDKRTAYGYPNPYDSNIYDRQFISALLKDAQFKNPFSLENYMNVHRDSTRPRMMCLEESCLISVCNNSIDQGANLPRGNQPIEFLNKKWMEGYRIKLEPFEDMKVTQCHIIKDYEFEKEG